MNKSLVIFGAGDIAELAFTYFQQDSGYTPVAFTVDAAFKETEEFCGLPVYDFESIINYFSPETHSIFIALSYSSINALRRKKYEEAKALGYSIASYISSHATVLNNGQYGENCFILEDNTIQPFVTIKDNVTLWSGNHIGHHSTIESHTFISSHVVVSGRVRVGEQSFIGVNSTLRDNITIGARAVIGAGATVLSDIPEEGVVKATFSELAKIPSSRLRRI